jgi:hypothetical protein
VCRLLEIPLIGWERGQHMNIKTPSEQKSYHQMQKSAAWSS